MIRASVALGFCFCFFLAFLYSRHFLHLLGGFNFWAANHVA